MRRRLLAMAIGAYLVALTANRLQLVVRGRSMEPTLHEGDRLLTAPTVGRALRAGMVVVVANPTNPAHLVVKRIAAIDDDCVTVFGDAPDMSTDSRHWGPLPRQAIRRIVVARWPDVTTRLHQ